MNKPKIKTHIFEFLEQTERHRVVRFWRFVQLRLERVPECQMRLFGDPFHERLALRLARLQHEVVVDGDLVRESHVVQTGRRRHELVDGDESRWR